MSVQCPVVYFELVDEDLHGASDLVDLEQQLSFLSLVRTCKVKNKFTATLKSPKTDDVV